MDRHFHCTACGRCCYGWLPLTAADALAHAGRFPLAVIWIPVKPASKAFAITAELGLTVRTRDRKQLAVRIMPTAYIPPAMPCPALTAENLCAIHPDKPTRCRTMPFFPYHEEADQAEQLVPRAGWTCDTSAAAPVVYRDKSIVLRDDFDRERGELIRQAPLLRGYGEALLARMPAMIDHLMQAARKPGGGRVAVSFASLLRQMREVDRDGVARAQLPVLAEYEAKAAAQPALAEYRRNYGDWAWEMRRYCLDAEAPTGD
jgi:Fe-S-cluster containining protein